MSNSDYVALERLPHLSGWTPRKASSRRSVILLPVVLGTFLLGTMLYQYNSGGTLLPNPFSSSSSSRIYEPFTPTGTWPPESPPIPKEIPTDDEGHRYPPLYPDVKAVEYVLPQHDEELPFPEGMNARFVRFANEQPGVGFNNQLKEV